MADHGVGRLHHRVCTGEHVTATATEAPCQHVWLSENRYRFRRCEHCGARPFEDALARLRARVHVHVGDGSGRTQPHGTCYGSYEVCGEHHAHDEMCGGRRLVCGRDEDRDGIALLEWIEARVNETLTSRLTGLATLMVAEGADRLEQLQVKLFKPGDATVVDDLVHDMLQVTVEDLRAE